MSNAKKRAASSAVPGTPEFDAPCVPVGIEQVLLMASVNPGFEAALFHSRHEAVVAGGLKLTSTEMRILASVDRCRLSQMAEQVSARVDAPTRRVFLERAGAAVVTLAASGVIVSGCKDSPQTTKAPGPDELGAPQRTPRKKPMVMDTPLTEAQKRYNRSRGFGITGIRPGGEPRAHIVRVVADGPREHDNELLWRVVKRHLAEVQYCWMSIGALTPPLPGGLVSLQVTVNPAGRVTQAKVDGDSLKVKKITDCFLSSARRWTFPKIRKQGNSTVEARFKFVPREKK